MRIRNQRNFSEMLLYLSFALAMLCLFFVGNHGEPLGLAVVYAMQSAGLSAFPSSFFYILSALPSYDLTVVLLYAAQAVLLSFGFFLQHRAQTSGFWKSGFFPLTFLSLGLGSFVAFAPFQAYALPFTFTENFTFGEIGQKVAIAAGVFLLSATFAVAAKALLKKFLKCRLRNDEIVFCVLFFTLIGVGMCRFLSVNAYMDIAFFILLLFACAVKDSSTMLAAFVCGLPPFLVANLSPERFFVYGVFIVLFIKSGRLAAAFAFSPYFLHTGT
ncbi:MAG: hypothetical protein IKA88_06060 [Clostridia bacterium]|nr:hypothetical protein [Clostridia bacterium]